MAKSRGTTDTSKTFFGVRHAQLRDWSWACLLIAGLACSHLWRAQAWERRLRSVPRATVSSLHCWLEDMDVPNASRHAVRSRRETGQRGAATTTATTKNRLRPEAVSKLQRLVDLNEASAEEWAQLPGIGPVLSRRIVKFRDALGGFASLNQLHQVYGLDSAVIERVRPSLRLEAHSHRGICLDTVTFRSLVRHPLFDAAQTRKVLRAWGRGTSAHAFWERVSATEAERQAWMPYLRVCLMVGGQDGVELER